MRENLAQGDRLHPGKYLTPFQRQLLETNLPKEGREQYQQRIKIMLLADEGKTQKEICHLLNCAPATVRHWVALARMGMAHQWQDDPIGRPRIVNQEYIERLQELVQKNPRDYGYAFERWTGNWLSKHLAKELGIAVHERHILRLLKEMGLSTRSQPHPPRASSALGKIAIQDLTPIDPSTYLYS